MMTEPDIERLLIDSQQHISSVIESDDYDIDDEDEQELIGLLQIECWDEDDDVDEHGAPYL